MNRICMLIVLLGFLQCKKSNRIYLEAYRQLPDSLRYNESENEFIPKAELGHYLFYDKNLSVNQSKSCASCHNPNLFFTDGYKKSLGTYADLQLRNTPSILNSVYFKTYNWANPSLQLFEQQMTTPLFNTAHLEMGMDQNSEEQAKRILLKYTNTKAYKQARKKNWNFIISCISHYMHLLVSRESRYDWFLIKKDSSILSDDERAGMRLFFSTPYNCAQCHGGIDFNTPTQANHYFVNTEVHSSALYKTLEDKGYIQKDNKQQANYTFRVPSLRNVAHTAPYMHDGCMANLNEVLQHYAKPGKQHPLLQGFVINEKQKNQIISFLQTLTDSSIFSKPLFLPAYK